MGGKLTDKWKKRRLPVWFIIFFFPLALLLTLIGWICIMVGEESGNKDNT